MARTARSSETRITPIDISTNHAWYSPVTISYLRRRGRVTAFPPPTPSVPGRSNFSSILGLLALALFVDDAGCLLRGFVHEKTHFGMRRLKINRKILLAQFLRSDRADRSDGNSREGFAKRSLKLNFLRDAKQMCHLNRSGEQRHVDFPACNSLHRLPERSGVFGQRPLIHRHPHCIGAAGGKPIEQFLIRRTVFLDGDAHAAQ